MSTRDLQTKYGRGNSRALINRAIRAELVGGDHCLDALNALDALKQKWLDRGWAAGRIEIEVALSHAHRLYALLRAEIRQRYGMPAEVIPKAERPALATVKALVAGLSPDNRMALFLGLKDVVFEETPEG